MKIKHLKEVDMGYWQHLRKSCWISIIVLIHGLFPWWLKEYAEKLLNT